MQPRYHAFMDGIAWAASAMIAARTRLEIATENLANVSSDGFRRIAARGFLTSLGAAIVPERDNARGGVPDRTLGGLHVSNGVDAISEMIDVLAAERSFESAQKAVTAIDVSRQKAAEAARIQ
jgi:flagellar basal body rod protein FlgG